MSDPRIKAEIFRQRTPCTDCPFKKEGGVRHGPERMGAYASYFVSYPGATFPCHKSVPKDDDRSQWSEWRDGQVICAGGLLLAAKCGVKNALVQYAEAHGLYDQASHGEAEKALVFDSVEDMVKADE